MSSILEAAKIIVEVLQKATYIHITVAFRVLIWTWGEILRYRQRQRKERRNIPDPLIGLINSHTFSRSQDYTSEKVHFNTFYEIFTMLIEICCIVTNVTYFFWQKSAYFAQLLYLNPESEVSIYYYNRT